MSEVTKNIESVATITVELSFGDRLAFLSNLLPQEGNILTMSIVKELTKKVRISQEEFELVEAKEVSNNRVEWNPNKAAALKPLHLALTKPELKIIQDKIKQLNDDNKITMEIVDLIEKFQLLTFKE